MTKIHLYLSTIAHLKPSQVAYRVWRRLGGKTPLCWGYVPKPDLSKASLECIPTLPELDFDSFFLARFDANALLKSDIELLHHKEHMDWSDSWHAVMSTPLWHFNLHYHEYLLPLAKSFLGSGDARYLEKAKAIIFSWIDSCPKEKGGVAWDPYVISIRTVNWLAFLGELSVELADDISFVGGVNASLAEQFVYLSQHLEKDLLANHFLENLKALVILASYFNDDETLDIALSALREQINEQVLPDGMHFELSPMYHKIVLEGLLRAAAFLKARGCDGDELAKRFRLQDMCDVLYSLERGVSRTPLFNDSGDNVAKGRDALLACARRLFGITPVYKSKLIDAGYAILERETVAGTVKVIFDAGIPGPHQAMGHAHCDALSIEVFVNSEPWIVNGGTYAYQGERRLDYKRTLSHSTVRVGGLEQHECWAPFRVARFSTARLERANAYDVEGILIQTGAVARVRRIVALEEDGILVRDATDSDIGIEASFIFVDKAPWAGDEIDVVPYAPEFGVVRKASRIVFMTSDGLLETRIPYPLSVQAVSDD